MYDSVDSFQVACCVTETEAKIFLDSLADKLPDRVDEFNRFLDTPSSKYGLSIQNIPRLSVGIQSVNIYRHKMYRDIIYIAISIKPEQLCTGKYTNRLFKCTKENVLALQYWYADAILDLCPAAFEIGTADNMSSGLSELPYLGNLIAKRADYALNCYSDDKDIAIMLISASHMDNRKHRIKFTGRKDPEDDVSDYSETDDTTDIDTDDDNYLSNSSNKHGDRNNNLYVVNKSSREYVYDKQRKYDDCGCASKELYDEAEGLIRIESSRRCLNNRWIIKKANLHLNRNERPCGILPWLSAEIADYYLKRFIDKFGREDWYCDEEATKLLDKAVSNGKLPVSRKSDGSERKNSKNSTVRNDIMPIISQSRSITKAYTNYQRGTYTLAKSNRIITGSADVFMDYISLIRRLGLQPLRIGDRYKVKHVENPIKHQILTGLDHKDFPARIMAMPNVVAKIQRITRLNEQQHIGYAREN